MERASQPPAAVALARDGNIAIAEELEHARHLNSIAAYDLFIARHPSHPLTAKAKEERNKLLHDRNSR